MSYHSIIPQDFEWDEFKNLVNFDKHGVYFEEAQLAFLDTHRIISNDLLHSGNEQRYFCFGKVDGEVVTVRFTYRGSTVRIIGAGKWRRGKHYYEKENNVHR